VTDRAREHNDAPSAPERALGDALRFSLRLLKLFMVLALAAYASAGIFSVPAGSVGLVAIAGRLVDDGAGSVVVYGPGLHITLPPPLGKVFVLPTQEVRSIETTGFWYREDAEDRLAELRRRSRAKPLVPGRDGSLIAGDGALFHARIRADYSVTDPVAYFRTFRLDRDLESAVLGRILARSVVGNALAVRMIAGQTPDTGATTLPPRVEAEVREAFRLRGLAVRISPVAFNVPIAVETAFVRKQNASTQALHEEENARREADSLRASAPARAQAIRTEAEIEAGTIRRRAHADAARADEIAPLLARNPALAREMVFDALREGLKGGTVHLVPKGGAREFRVRLTPPPASRAEEKPP
jgi:regulator of protease activity HflC (stomatin/prohibitin superfamily)